MQLDELAQEASLIRNLCTQLEGIEQNLNQMWKTETNVHGYETAEMRELSEFCRAAIE